MAVHLRRTNTDLHNRINSTSKDIHHLKAGRMEDLTSNNRCTTNSSRPWDITMTEEVVVVQEVAYAPAY